MADAASAEDEAGDADGRPGPTIVVGWDGSDAARGALRTATRLARDGRVIVVHAHEAAAPHVTSRWRELLQADGARRSLLLLAEIPAASDADLELVRIEARSLDGPPADALLRTAREDGADAIAVGSRGLGAGPGAVGSVSAALLASTDRPVLVVPPAAAHPTPGA
ncbi:universal stress protein [Baekduia soli]|uniref:Universal stress protein n=1 Tax=Baekduia soli TaxID=496014 RepID=A0A5B8UB41_9ACTN|nr:universal stress protein [Baekduia soli]QEC49841.1 universal stress protein [Baekduia soli]